MKPMLVIVGLVIVGALFWPGPPAWCRWMSPSVLRTMIRLRSLEGVELTEATDFGEF
jgi:hypothetical protein